ncbi:MAG: hypothetical protein JWM53_1163 [bacterium]|nr:hypothetical protein [bacterium]
MRRRARILTHVVGGVGIVLSGEFPTVAVAHSDEPPFTVLHLAAQRTTGPLRPHATPVCEVDSWAAFLDGEELHLCIKHSGHQPPEIVRIELPRDGLQGRFLHTHDWPPPFVYPLDQLLVVHTLGVAGGALMHAAAIAGRDGALLCAGPSGAGKSTMSLAVASLGAHVLSDERTVVRRDADDRWLAGGTPWPGEAGLAENRSVPLRGLILLEQADHDELIPLSPARALALLYRCHFPPLWDQRACDRTLDNLERLVRDVPAFLFRNRKGIAAAEQLLARVGGAG